MKWLKITLLSFIFLSIIFVGIGFVLPKKIKMSRTILIEVQVDKIFPLVNDLRNWKNWSPWTTSEWTSRITYSPIKVGEGANIRWTNQNFGNASVTILESQENKKINTTLNFENHEAFTFWTFEPIQNGEKTQVTWRFHSSTDTIMGRYSGLLIDTSLGPYFKIGLRKLKILAEQKNKKTEE